MSKTGRAGRAGRVVFAAGAALVGAAAMAETQTQVASYVAASTDLGAVSLAVDQFDPSLGVLNAVSLSFAGSITASSSVVNNSASLLLTNVQVSLFGDFRATRSPGSSVPLPGTVDLVAPSSFLGSRIFTILGPGAHTNTGPFTLVPDPAGLSFQFTSSADLAGFTGLGTLGYAFSTHSSALVPARFTTVALQPSATSSATMTVIYDYTPSAPVPEPASGALLLAGLCAVGAVLRRGDARSRLHPVA